MTDLTWPVVTLALGLGVLALGFIVVVLALRRRDTQFATQAFVAELAADFRAFTTATEAKVGQLEETVRKTNALSTELARSRLPSGLRGVGL